MNTEQAEAIKLMQQVLQERYANLDVQRVLIEEDVIESLTSVTCEVASGDEEGGTIIAGKGVGVVDAFFQGFVSRFAGEYPSLKTIQFASFHLDAKLDTRSDFAGSDAQGVVTIEVLNSEKRRFAFSHASRSVITSSIITVLRALEYFVNSERAYVNLYEAVKDAAQRNREDLVRNYTAQMAVLVRNTSYSEVIEKIKAEAGR